MTEFSSWFASNWFYLIQTAGIMGSLWLAAAAASREAKAREIQNLLTLSEHHRELWGGVYRRRELDRIFQTESDVLRIPASVAEEEFINLVMVHFQTGWRIAKAGGITTLAELAADVRGFFSLPLPRAVWEKTKELRNPRFVRFVEGSLKIGI